MDELSDRVSASFGPLAVLAFAWQMERRLGIVKVRDRIDSSMQGGSSNADRLSVVRGTVNVVKQKRLSSSTHIICNIIT